MTPAILKTNRTKESILTTFQNNYCPHQYWGTATTDAFNGDSLISVCLSGKRSDLNSTPAGLCSIRGKLKLVLFQKIYTQMRMSQQLI